MAKNFRLAYSTGFDYTDLLPQTLMENIEDKEGSVKHSTVVVEVPITEQTTQTIPMTFTQAQVDGVCYIALNDKSPETELSYSTLSKVEVKNDGLEITRLFSKPTAPISITLVFEEADV